MNRQTKLAALLCAAVLVGCDYTKDTVQDITAPDPGSRIRFFNFGVNAPSVNFYANDTKVTAISSTSCTLPPLSEACTTTGVESTTGTGYGGVGLAGLYSALPPGPYTFTGRIAAATDKNLPISTVNATLENGKYYSFYMSGFYDATAKTVEGFVVEDPVVPPSDFVTVNVRFVHAISNANRLTLYAKNTTSGIEVPIGSEVSYKGAGAFTSIPAGTYDLRASFAGATTNALTRPGVVFSTGGRVYTITARGDITVAPSTACASTNRTCLDNTLNR